MAICKSLAAASWVIMLQLDGEGAVPPLVPAWPQVLHLEEAWFELRFGTYECVPGSILLFHRSYGIGACGRAVEDQRLHLCGSLLAGFHGAFDLVVDPLQVSLVSSLLLEIGFSRFFDVLSPLGFPCVLLVAKLPDTVVGLACLGESLLDFASQEGISRVDSDFLARDLLVFVGREDNGVVLGSVARLGRGISTRPGGFPPVGCPS